MDYYKNLDLNDIVYFCEFYKIWKTEKWKDIPNYEGIYQISDLGRIKSLNYRRTKKSNILKQNFLKDGYLITKIYKDLKAKTFTTHKLVCISFLNHTYQGHKFVVNHKNFIRTDNRLFNLEIVTNRENTDKAHIKSSSKYVGVSWLKNRKKWIARIRIGKEHKYLGLFKNEEDAYKAYKQKLKEITMVK